MKKVISLLLIVSMLVIAMPVFAIGGEGTEANPYLVATPQDVINIHNDLNGYYKLTADIDMSGIDFEPIGNESEGAFTGTIDGDGHTISNLTIEDYKYCGFVGYMDGGEIKNLNFANGSISGFTSLEGYTGGVVAYLNSGIVYNSVVNSSVTGGTNTGGVVGINYGDIVKCINNGDIFGVFFTKPDSGYYIGSAGGIVGSNHSVVKNCSNNGCIDGRGDNRYRCIGGIAGYNDSDIMNSINNGKVYMNGIRYSYETYVGGIIGGQEFPGTFHDCVNNGVIFIDNKIDNQGKYFGGGICGYIDTAYYNSNFRSYNCINSAIISDSNPQNGALYYYAGGYNTSSSFYNLGTMPTNILIPELAPLKEMETYIGFDFENIWYIDPNTNSGFPQLRNMPRHIQLNESVEIFEVGDNDKLIAYLDGATENVKWSSDDETIATVSADGTVVAKSIGACTVTATNDEGMKANCLIYIYGRAESMALNKSEISLAIGSTETLTYTQLPSTANENVTWHSEDETIAAVSQSGLVTAKKSGKTTISAVTVNSEIVASCEVTVTGKPITSLSISPSSTTMHTGETKQLSVSIYPSDYQGTIAWSSTDENVVTVDANGLITANYPGMAYIYAKSDSGVVAQCTITVKAPSSEIKLNKSELTLQKGYTEKLLPTMLPEYSTDTISWTSSNSSYVSVSSDGTVTAKAVGQAIITATTASGKKAYCTVYVINPSVSVSSVTLDKTELIMTKADIAQLKATVLPSNATNQNLIWASSNESVATVNSTGVVTAVDTGVAIISATANNGVYHECVVKVISASGSSVILSDAKASPDGTVQVKASIVKNPGISGYKFTVNYDESILTPVKVSNNSDFGGSITTNLADSNRTGLNIVWHANEDVTVNGELFTIDFKVSDIAEYGDTSSVSLEYGAKDICNTAGEYFALYVDGATISIEEPLPGDVYEDDEVTVYDLTLLSRYITSLETFTERQIEAADVNNDGDVTVLDVIKVAQYLTGWSNVELMSVGLFSLRESAAPVISVGSASVNSANETEIPVYIKNNTGIAAYRFVLDYNEDDIEILSITPSDLIDKDAFNTNLGAESQAEDGLIVTSRTSGGNMSEDGVLFTIKVRYKNPPATSVSPISIIDDSTNIGNQSATYVTASYETGYVLGDDYIVANKVVGDTNFSCELFFDDSYEEQSAKSIIAFYDGDGRMVQFKSSDITVKPGKVYLSIDYEKKAYSTYKLMIWEGMNSLKPVTEVK